MIIKHVIRCFGLLAAAVVIMMCGLAEANGQNWQKIPGQLKEIAAGGAEGSPAVWGLSPGGRLMHGAKVLFPGRPMEGRRT